mgnify:CR=1 FL=1
MESSSLTLAELNNHIRDIVEANFPEELWVVAEISELNVNSRGHCYIDFIERDELTKKIVARQRATIWAFQYRLISGHFESMTRQPLSIGMKVLINVQVKYHVLYGLSLNVVDIDPAYTLGEQARHREAVIKQLEEDGVLEMNKGLELDLVPLRLAIISSETAAGYDDFVNHLEFNAYGYKFELDLYAASMQGENTSKSVVEALDKIYIREQDYDAILIIRGGGAKAELSAFDDYDMAFMISQSPLPVLTGIGHERDETVTDIVAFRAFKTPTAVADFLIERVAQFDTSLNELTTRLDLLVRSKLDNEKASLEKSEYQISSVSKSIIQHHKFSLEQRSSRLSSNFKQFIYRQQNKTERLSKSVLNASNWYIHNKKLYFDQFKNSLQHAKSRYITTQIHKFDLLQEKVSAFDPDKLLKTGYGYITKNGQRITSISELDVKDQISIAFIDGQAGATIEEIHAHKKA